MQSSDLCEFAMRVCFNCERTSKFDKCKVNERSFKCVKCIRFNCDCDLTFFSSVKWRRLESQRQKLQTEFRETFARMRRLQKQIEFLKFKKRKMMKSEFRNIDDLKMRKRVSNIFIFNEFFIDVQFEELELSADFDDWVTNFFSETVAEASDSSWDFSLTFKCLRYVRNLFT